MSMPDLQLAGASKHEIIAQDQRKGICLLSKSPFTKVDPKIRRLISHSSIWMSEGDYANLNMDDISQSLICAVRKEDEKVVMLLIEGGANVNVMDEDNKTILHYAVENGNEKIVKLLMEGGADVNAQDSDSKSILHVAVGKGNEKMFKLLVEGGANVNAQDSDYSSILHFAVEKGDHKIVKLLLEGGAHVDVPDLDYKTALHCAVENGHEKIVKLLLEAGADVDAEDSKDKTPLHIGSENANANIVKLLLEGGADVNLRGGVAGPILQQAVKSGSEEIVKLLLEAGADVNAISLCSGLYFETILYFAVKGGDKELIKLLLQGGAEYYYTVLHFFESEKEETNIDLLLECIAKFGTHDQENEKLLQFGVKNGIEKLVKPLLEGGADVNALDENRNNILSVAAEEGHVVIVELILKYCPDININQSNRKPINAAVHGNGEETSKIVESLLNYGFTVDPEDVYDDKLLLDAASRGCGKVVESLIKYGADVNMLTKSEYGDGYAPLHTATEWNQEEVVELLINSGADVNCKDMHGKTAIFYAAEIACLKSAKLLLTNSDISFRDEHGRSPLHFVAMREHDWYVRDCPNNDMDSARAEIAKLLLSKGACVNAQDEDGMTILHAACNEGYVKVVQVLLEHDADTNSRDNSRRIPLHLSAQQGSEAISKMLLDSGANVNAEQKDGPTSLDIAIDEGHTEIVKLLLEFGADTESKIDNKRQPLHSVARKGYCEIIETILKFGADVDGRDVYGRTALHIASTMGFEKIVETLLEYGADINITSAHNYTALDYAKAGIKYSPHHNYKWDDEMELDHSTLLFKRAAFCKETLKALTFHLVKMKVANFYVSEQNLGFISDYDGVGRFIDDCSDERKRMKTEKVGNANVSFDDVLTKDTHSLAICMGNEGIVQVLKTGDYKTKFPIYASMIENRVKRAMERKDLNEQGKKNFNLLFTELHHDCSEKILSYLNDADIRLFIVACRPILGENPQLFAICKNDDVRT